MSRLLLVLTKGAEVSLALISHVTDVVLADVVEWQISLLEAVCPIAYLGCIVVKICQDGRYYQQIDLFGVDG